MTDYLAWVFGTILGCTGYAVGYAIEAFCVAYAVRKGWDLVAKR